MSRMSFFGTLSLCLIAAGICPCLHAQSPVITAYTEYHTQKDGSNSADAKKAWQTIDLNAALPGDGSLLGWRQWGGRSLDFGLVNYDGSQGAASKTSGGISDLIGYARPNTYVGSGSYFFADYLDGHTGDAVKESRNDVFTFDSLLFTVPADAKPKLLRLWTGAYACDGEMDVDLLSPTGDILTSYTKTMARPGANGDAAAPDFFYGYWRFRYQGTAPDETLRVRWHALNRTVNNANIFVQAAALTSAPAPSSPR